MSDSKEQFEAWAAKHMPEIDGLPISLLAYVGGEYHDSFVNAAWQAWQASRQALVVELPEPFALGDGHGLGLDPEDTRAAIEAAGVRVKQ